MALGRVQSVQFPTEHPIWLPLATQIPLKPADSRITLSIYITTKML